MIFRQFLDLICLISAEIAPATDPIGIEQLSCRWSAGLEKFEDEIVVVGEISLIFTYGHASSLVHCVI